VRIESRRGVCTLRAQVVATIRPDTVFVPYHWGGAKSVNQVTIAAQDPISKIPEFKVCAVRLLRQYGPLPTVQAGAVFGLLILATSLFHAAYAAAIAWISQFVAARRPPLAPLLARRLRRVVVAQGVAGIINAHGKAEAMLEPVVGGAVSALVAQAPRDQSEYGRTRRPVPGAAPLANRDVAPGRHGSPKAEQ